MNAEPPMTWLMLRALGCDFIKGFKFRRKNDPKNQSVITDGKFIKRERILDRVYVVVEFI